jgi:phosphoglycolate phosphatase-like HAD superfamily hydrolase
MKAVLFDIDGTLIRAGGAGREALSRGAAAAFGIPVETVREFARGIDFRGRVDRVLIREFAVRAGRDPGAEAGRVLDLYLAALPGTLRDAPYEVLPGVVELVAALERRADVVVGLLTGNVREGARLKLGRAGLGLERLVERPGGFGDDGDDRFEVARAAVARALAAGARSAADVVVVGDTEHDVLAAHAAGARAVGVLTGWTPREALAAADPGLLVSDLGEPGPILEFLDA